MAHVAVYKLLVSLFVGCNYWWPFASLDKCYSPGVCRNFAESPEVKASLNLTSSRWTSFMTLQFPCLGTFNGLPFQNQNTADASAERPPAALTLVRSV